MSLSGHEANDGQHYPTSPYGNPPVGAHWTVVQRQAVGADILAAADDADLLGELVYRDPVGTINSRHPGLGLSAEGLRELLGLVPGDAEPRVRKRLAARIISRSKGHNVDNDGRMCGCGG